MPKQTVRLEDLLALYKSEGYDTAQLEELMDSMREERQTSERS